VVERAQALAHFIDETHDLVRSLADLGTRPLRADDRVELGALDVQRRHERRIGRLGRARLGVVDVEPHDHCRRCTQNSEAIRRLADAVSTAKLEVDLEQHACVVLRARPQLWASRLADLHALRGDAPDDMGPAFDRRVELLVIHRLFVADEADDQTDAST
jgi:hypothetical protein